jgi:hypothetical protein
MYTDLELFKSLYPNSTQLQKMQVSKHNDDQKVEKNLKFYNNILNYEKKLDFNNNNNNNVNNYNDNKNSNDNNINKNSNDNNIIKDNNNNYNNNQNNNEETALKLWQQYTIEKILKEKYTTKKTLPVLVASSKTILNNNSKKTVFTKAKRWSGGTLVETSIEIPHYFDNNNNNGEFGTTTTTTTSSYLNAYKNNNKVHTTTEDRNKAIEAIHLITNEKKAVL